MNDLTAEQIRFIRHLPQGKTEVSRPSDMPLVVFQYMVMDLRRLGIMENMQLSVKGQKIKNYLNS